MDYSKTNTELEIKHLKRTIFALEKRILDLEKESQNSKLAHIHLMRVKNQEELSDQYLLRRMGYLDLSPDKAYELYNNKNSDFTLLDVSVDNYTPFKNLDDSRNIPLEELEERISELPSKNKHIFVISEKGVRSIRACKILNKHGFYNLSHISGGFKCWPGFRLSYDNSEFDDFLKEA